MESLKYVAFYDSVASDSAERDSVLSATNKVDYVVTALNRIGLKVDIVSACISRGSRSRRGKTTPLNSLNTLTLPKSFSGTSRIGRVLSRLSAQLSLFVYIVRRVRKNENVLAYHSVSYANLLVLARRLKKFRLILEVEEIYADVSGRTAYRRKEFRVFRQADAFVFSTELLNKKLNQEHKPYAVAYGTYQVESPRGSSFDDRRIHVVYAGTLDPRKGGATAAVSAAEFLDDGYHLHVIGFGSADDTRSLLSLIETVSQKTACKVTYDGLLGGEQYVRFLQSCDIGLSTQLPGAAFNDTSFPSKVVSYMANGLRVVSIRIRVLEQSTVDDLLFYYEEDTPEAVAAAIKSIDVSEPYDSRERLTTLDDGFLEALQKVLRP